MTGDKSHQRVWVLDWRLLVFAGLFLPLLLGLGTWQLNRAGEKQELLTQWAEADKAEAWHQLEDRKQLLGTPVTIRGQYTGESWLLDNRTRDGAPGYEVLTLFSPEEGKPVVINRGWIAGARVRDRLPEFTTPAGPVVLQARLSDYPEPPVLADDADADQDGTWPKRVQALPRQTAAQKEPAVAEWILKLEDRNQPGAFRADWEPDMMGPQTHYGYALQWFSLAVALFILTIIASYRKQES